MNDSLISIARDNTIRVSALKLNNIAKLIVIKIEDNFHFDNKLLYSVNCKL